MKLVEFAMPNDKFKIVEAKSLEQMQEVWDDLNLDNYYAVLFKTDHNINIENIEKFASQFGNFLTYGDKNYIIFDTVFNETPLHFDGISTKEKSRIPDRLFFYVDQAPQTHEGNFKILNCESVLYNLGKELKKFLKTTKLEYYGYPTFANENPGPFDLVFSVNSIWEYEGTNVLRMQIPSNNKKYIIVEDDFVYCKGDNYRTKFNKMSGQDTAHIFKSIHNEIESNNNLMEIKFETGDFLITKNKFTFHGRHGTTKPLKRKMYRFQTINN